MALIEIRCKYGKRFISRSFGTPRQALRAWREMLSDGDTLEYRSVEVYSCEKDIDSGEYLQRFCPSLTSDFARVMAKRQHLVLLENETD